MRNDAQLGGLAVLTLWLLSGCVACGPNNRTVDPVSACEPAQPNFELCHAEYVPALPLDALRKHGAALVVVCDFWSVVDESYRSTCRERVYEAAADLARRFPAELEPIDIQKLVFEQTGTCIDTFIPGREAADCFDYLRISLPLVWKAPLKSGSDP